MTEGDEELLQEFMETFTDLNEVPGFLNPHLEILVELSVRVSLRKEFQMNLREMGIYFLQQCLDKKAKVVKNNPQMAKLIMETGFKLACEPEEEGTQEKTRILHLII